MGEELSENGALLQGVSSRGPRSNSERWVTASIAVHACILGLFFLHQAPRLTQPDRPGDRNGHNLLLTYSPGSSSPAAALQAEKAPAPKSTPLPTPTAPAVAKATPSSPSTVVGTDTGSGNDALGDGNITLALELAHPYPKPDLSRLPSGTRGDVIVDVVIDKTGRIAKSTLAHGLGNGIDETVLATIQQWTFQPATRNGVPVASEQELLFHYERG
jgi:protein TonB